MENTRLVVIRTDDNVKSWIWKELQEGRLRQGWGVPELQLSENGKVVGLDIWKERYKISSKKYWDYDPQEYEIIKRYWILYPMVELKRGNIVVIPKIPSYDTFLIAIVTEGYEFDYVGSEQREGHEDYRHIIHIDNKTLKSFNYSSFVETRTVLKKMRAYQSAVNNVYNEDFIVAIQDLLTKEGDVTPKGTADLFRDIREPLLKSFLREIRKLRFSDLENLVKNIFQNVGYEISETHKFDKKGGDADIIFTHTLPLLSAFEDIDLKIYIQVK